MIKIFVSFSVFPEEPQPTQHCPRRHGYFAHEDEKICDTFFYCVDGKFNMITCPAGLVFNSKTGICTWADEAKKKNCGSKGKYRFIYWFMEIRPPILSKLRYTKIVLNTTQNFWNFTDFFPYFYTVLKYKQLEPGTSRERERIDALKM